MPGSKLKSECPAPLGGRETRTGRSDAKSVTPALHHVRLVQLRRDPELESGEVSVVLRRYEPAAALEDDLRPPCRFRPMHAGHARSPEVAAPVARPDEIALLHLLDRPQ